MLECLRVQLLRLLCLLQWSRVYASGSLDGEALWSDEVVIYDDSFLLEASNASTASSHIDDSSPLWLQVYPSPKTKRVYSIPIPCGVYSPISPQSEQKKKRAPRLCVFLSALSVSIPFVSVLCEMCYLHQPQLNNFLLQTPIQTKFRHGATEIFKYLKIINSCEMWLQG